MPLKPCLDCGRLSSNSRCPTHTRARERGRTPRPTSQTRDWAERKRRADVVAAHREVYGELCPGWQDRPAHQVISPNVLTADHDHAVGNGGDPYGSLTVRCRVCNGVKAAKV